MTQSQIPQYTPLGPAEKDALASQLRDAHSIAIAFADYDGAGPITLDQIDRAYAVWYEQGIDDQAEINTAINAFGAALGDLLVRSLGFEWGILTNEFDTQLTVRASPGGNDLFICPSNFVAKRWRRGEVGFFGHSYRAIVGHIAEIANQGLSASK